jgi:hypothetical protein
MTFAACVTETVGTPFIPTTDALWAALIVGSLPGVADPLDGVDGALVAARAGEDEGAWVAGLGEAAVDVTADGESTFVTG